MTWQQLQELSPSGFDIRSRNYHCEFWDSFHAHSGGEECRHREALPNLQCKSFCSSFQVKTTGFPTWILSMEQQSSSETAAVMNFYSFVNGVMQTLWIRESGKREGTKSWWMFLVLGKQLILKLTVWILFQRRKAKLSPLVTHTHFNTAALLLALSLPAWRETQGLCLRWETLLHKANSTYSADAEQLLHGLLYHTPQHNNFCWGRKGLFPC